MKQRIRVVGLVRGGDGVLILKRSRGRSEIPVFWELPTGKIGFGEQPEEAMARVLTEDVKLMASAIRLRDVITFLALEGSSQLNNLYIVYEINVVDGARPSPSGRWTTYKYVKDYSTVKLNEASVAVLEIEDGELDQNKVKSREVANSAMVYVDGASRGNPGPAGVGYCIFAEDGRVLKRGGEFIGFASSRVAEYYALKEGLEQATELGLKSVRVFSDSLMVVNQMKGIFQVKNRDVVQVYQDVQKLLENFDAFAIFHVPRLQNSAADKEANLAISRSFEKR